MNSSIEKPTQSEKVENNQELVSQKPISEERWREWFLGFGDIIREAVERISKEKMSPRAEDL